MEPLVKLVFQGWHLALCPILSVHTAIVLLHPGETPSLKAANGTLYMYTGVPLLRKAKTFIKNYTKRATLLDLSLPHSAHTEYGRNCLEQFT